MMSAQATERSVMKQHDAEAKLQPFIDGLVRKRGGHIPGGRLQRLGARLVPAQSRTMVRIAVTDTLSPWEKQKAARLTKRGAVRLHLGSGELPRDGWVNVDLYGVPVDLCWNLNRSLPFRNGTVEAVFHEHVLEHLRIDRGLQLTRDCFRVLKPGGVVRIAIPDARRHVGWYWEGRLPAEREGHAIPVMSLLQQFYGHGHQVMYDFELVALLCHAAGFATVEQRAFRSSRLDPAPDHEWREWDSLYVEAVR
jgi:predicted SAM-dependent methyltransferase